MLETAEDGTEDEEEVFRTIESRPIGRFREFGEIDW